MAKKRKKSPKQVETIVHDEAKRTNIPTAEFQSFLDDEAKHPIQVAYERRNPDLDPQLVWRGKDLQDWSDLVAPAPPLFIQEKVHPKVLIDALRARTSRSEAEQSGFQADLFADFNGLPNADVKTDFYQHDANWTNRMILGDSLQVMASLAEREGLRGKVQCIYFDPPYGIKFNSNFQWSTTSRDVRDGKADHITREPEQVKAFRDTWRDGIHSYLTYLRDRLTVARELLAENGSIFVQIGDENVHRVRCLLDEIFGEDCKVVEIVVKKKGSQRSSYIDSVNDYILWYGKSPRSTGSVKFRTLYEKRAVDADTVDEFSRVESTTGQQFNLKKYTDSTGQKLDFRQYPSRVDAEFPAGSRLFRPWPITNGGHRPNQMDPVMYMGESVTPPKGNCWRHTSRPQSGVLSGMGRLQAAGRLIRSRTALDYKRYLDDFPFKGVSNWWDGFGGAPNQVYVVQTNERVVERCILMATDPGELVLDPTCGSGTTAAVAERWGRRWITVDTSRVALALARARLMGTCYPFFLLSDSAEGQEKESAITGRGPKVAGAFGNDVRHGFVYRRSPYITSGVVANNSEIDVIWERFQEILGPLRSDLNTEVDEDWEEWQIPRDVGDGWSARAKGLHAEWWQQSIARQKEIDASIAASADYEYLYDRPYEAKGTVRVAGPFTVESLSPHRTLAVDEKDELVDKSVEPGAMASNEQDFTAVILENLRSAGVQQVHKEDKIAFSSVTPWPGYYVCAEGRYTETGDDAEGEGVQRRAAIFVGPEFGTVSRQDLIVTAREAVEAGFDVLIACAFSFEAHTTEFTRLGKLPILKARMNADLHMADELKNTGQGNLFVIFGEPDIDILPADGDDAENGQIQVRIKGVDVFHPSTGEIRSDDPDGIACWFIDTDYNEESFFVRHAYFLGANDPYKALKTTLKAEIDREAWETLHSEVSRPFDKPSSGRIAVKVINHLGDEVMKVFRVDG